MKKERVIKGILKYINKVAEEKNLEIKNLTEEYASDDTLYGSLLKECDVPLVRAMKKGYEIQLNPYVEDIRLSIARSSPDGEEILEVIFSDNVLSNNSYSHVGNYVVQEVKCDCHGNYKSCMIELYDMIDYIISDAVKYE